MSTHVKLLGGLNHEAAVGQEGTSAGLIWKEHIDIMPLAIATVIGT